MRERHTFCCATNSGFISQFESIERNSVFWPCQHFSRNLKITSRGKMLPLSRSLHVLRINTCGTIATSIIICSLFIRKAPALPAIAASLGIETSMYVDSCRFELQEVVTVVIIKHYVGFNIHFHKVSRGSENHAKGGDLLLRFVNPLRCKSSPLPHPFPTSTTKITAKREKIIKRQMANSRRLSTTQFRLHQFR